MNLWDASGGVSLTYMHLYFARTLIALLLQKGKKRKGISGVKFWFSKFQKLSKVDNGQLAARSQCLRNGRDKHPVHSGPERKCCCENESPLGSSLLRHCSTAVGYQMSHTECFSLAYLEKIVWTSDVWASWPWFWMLIRWLWEVLFGWTSSEMISLKVDGSVGYIRNQRGDVSHAGVQMDYV